MRLRREKFAAFYHSALLSSLLAEASEEAASLWDELAASFTDSEFDSSLADSALEEELLSELLL